MPLHRITEALQQITLRSDHDPVLLHRITEALQLITLQQMALQQMAGRSRSGHLKSSALYPRKDLCRSSSI
ncbi:MAG: hypothetical protein KME15_01980 [Drouetiella hepatica Uher 2000/2452]|jgi:hypothetical protein|uniref:Uncharacterized protein n=1 Tax=Drouetiella hepatica Uher 2000/2452 TaxID=904376 RepID=A0A951Q7P3_9CYAN|nr:hypothetical protein [Drouetiella hepatica Uher 2000/2452]